MCVVCVLLIALIGGASFVMVQTVPVKECDRCLVSWV